MDVDMSRAARTRQELTSLAEAVRDAPPSEPETDNLEWKGEWDPSDGEQAFETARHVLGFGNRAVAVAAQAFEGCAYLFAGVEPGRVVGTPVLDPATIEDKLGRYVETGRPRWSPHYLSIDGEDVLVVVIEAPRDGDPICTLQKGYGRIREGRIFVRRHGQTEEARPAEIRALEERTRSTRPTLSLTIDRADEGSLQALSTSSADRDAWLEAEEKRLALPPKPARAAGLFDPISVGLNEDHRSRESYGAEVATYLDRARGRYLGLVVLRGIDEHLAEVRLRLLNPTERNYEGVETVLELAEGLVWVDRDEVVGQLKQLEPPRPWGRKSRFEITPPASVVSAFESTDTVQRREGGSTVRFGARHVRPRAEIELPPVHVTLTSGGEDLTIGWSLSSTSVDGRQEGKVVYSVEDERVPVTIVGE